MRQFSHIIVSITNRCNLKCRMCDIPAEKTEELTTDEWKKVISDSIDMGAQVFVLSGGEPLIRKDVFELFSYAKSLGLITRLCTNGTMIDDEVARKLSDTGIQVAIISIDGPEEIHDSLRGPNAYNKAIKALEYLKNNNVMTTLAFMVSSYNYKYMPHIVEVAKQYDSKYLLLQPFNNLFINDNSKGDDFFIHKDDVEELHKVIDAVTKECRESKIDMNSGPYLDSLPAYLSKQPFETKGACDSLWDVCPINSKGEVYPCWVITGEEYLLGDLKKQSIREIWNSDKHNTLRDKIVCKGCSGCLMSCYDRR